MQQNTYFLSNETITGSFGKALANILVSGLRIYLHGDLGAGKTTLTRALLRATGHTGRVKSPTYTLVEPYEITLNGRPVEVFHFDLYRMCSPEEFLDAGFREYFNGNTICIVEWPENAQSELPLPDLTISLEIAGDGRTACVTASSEKGERCLENLHFSPQG